MKVYFLDRYTLEIKDILPVIKYEINKDEETNAISKLTFHRKPNADSEDYIKVGDGQAIFQGIIKEIQGSKNSNQTEVNCLDISNIFNRKIYESNLSEMNVGLEDFIYDTIITFFKNGNGDSLLAMNYLTVSQTTSTEVIEPLNAVDNIYNFHDFIVNCRRNKNIAIHYQLEQGELIITILNIGLLDNINIDTTLSDVINYEKVYEIDYTAKVTAIAGDTGLIKTFYLKSDDTVTDNSSDPLRIMGKSETTYVPTEAEMAEQVANIFKENKYNHLIEFDIRKDSKLVNTDQIEIGTPITIKTNDGIIYSYISSLSFEDTDNFIKYKSGKIRTKLTEKLKQTNYTAGINKLDKSGGTITGDITFQGIINGIFPIDSIYMSVNNINPSIYFGGTWIAWGTGRTPVGVDTGQTEFDTVEKTGGHKLLQAHTHAQVGNVINSGSTGYRNLVGLAFTGSAQTVNATATTGGGNAENLQPYITCYMWKRTA